MGFGDFKSVSYDLLGDEFRFVDEAGTVRSVCGEALFRLQRGKKNLLGVELPVFNQTPKSSPKIISTSVRSSSRLVAFLYFLLRDKLPASDVAEIVQQLSECQASGVVEFIFSNGWIAGYAEDIARYLLEDGTTVKDFSVQADELPTKHGGVVEA